MPRERAHMHQMVSMILLCLYVTEALLSNEISGKRKPKCCTQIASQKTEACQNFENFTASETQVRLSSLDHELNDPLNTPMKTTSALRRLANIIGIFIDIPTEEPWLNECKYEHRRTAINSNYNIQCFGKISLIQSHPFYQTIFPLGFWGHAI